MENLVSIIIPCRNEEKYIAGCLNSLLLQDFPKENLEVLVVDGMSEDKTREIVEKFKIQNSKFKILLLDNPKKFTPFGLNIGIKEARGDIIMRMDAHAGYEKDYISKCVKHLKDSGADNVGGIIKTIPSQNTISAKAVAICLGHRFGAGTSYFRVGVDRPQEVDTVFGGCYKRGVFDKVGFFDDRLIRSQDIEFNKRLKGAGGKIILFPDIVAYYYPQSTLFGFLKHNFEDGIWTTYPLKFYIKIFSFRHLFPLFFVSAVILSLFFAPFFGQARLIFDLIFGSYLLASLFFSVQIFLKEKNFRYLFLMPIVFGSRHFGYGLGSLWGLIKLLF